MGTIRTLGRFAWRLWQTDGVPASLEHRPSKIDIRAFVDEVDSKVELLTASQGGGAYAFATAAGLQAFDPAGGAAENNALGIVQGDPGGSAVDGRYKYVFGTTSWTRLGALDVRIDGGNSAAGLNALGARTTGDGNSAFGSGALALNQSGDNNVAIGKDALASYLLDESVAIGHSALSSATGVNNVAVGTSAGGSILGGTQNTFIGYSAGSDAGQLASAVNTIGIGKSVFTTADNQIAIGNVLNTHLVMFGATMMIGVVGERNYFFGGAGNLTGAAAAGANIGIGEWALHSFVTATNNVAVGDFAMSLHESGTGNVAIGSSAMRDSESCIDNTCIGYEAGRHAVTGVGTTAIGRRAAAKELISNNTTAVGDSALWLNQGVANNGLGYRVAEYFITGDNNIWIGRACGVNRGTGNENIYIGNDSGDFPGVTPNPLTGAGAQAAGDRNTVVGFRSLRNFTGNDATAYGHQTLLASVSGAGNSAFGVSAGRTLQTGSNNTFVGFEAGFNALQKIDAVNSIAIGAGAYTTASNQAVIGPSTIVETILRGTITMAEMTAPAAPAANGARIYSEDDGAGKTRLMALFATGAAQQMAIQP